jgi:diguanylate cyclase (GGDEF)-like protein
MARANLGFALMGQGRIAEGAPWVDGVIDELTAAGATTDLDAMLDEKGRMQEQGGAFREALGTVRAQQAVQQTNARAARDRAIATLQEEYEAGQRTRQIDLLRRENALKDADLHSRRLVQLATSFAAVLTVLAGAIVWILYRRAARSNAQLQLLNTQLEYHSMRDALTGLHNRRSFADKMRQRSQRRDAERRSDGGRSVDCLALMDIDHFKHINDRWGHGVGDAVLVEVARRLTAAVRDTDMVLRWGGEEFLIYAPGTDPAFIADMIARVLDGIGGSVIDGGSCRVPVTLSAGVVTLTPGQGMDWERGIRLADWALYQCKAGGRNQARIVTSPGGPLDAVLAAIDKGGTVPVTTLAVHGPAQQAAA